MEPYISFERMPLFTARAMDRGQNKGDNPPHNLHSGGVFVKYHKIRGVEMSVCTAEQKIAYNLAWRANLRCGERFRECLPLVTFAEAKHAASKLAREMLDEYRLSYNYQRNPGRYTEDAIFSALLAGMYDYLCKPFIATDFARIGQAFPAYYLEA